MEVNYDPLESDIDRTNKKRRLFDSETYSDVIIRFDDTSMNAHKMILDASSPYFQAAFQGQFAVKKAEIHSEVKKADFRVQEGNPPALELRDNNNEAVYGMIAFIYGFYTNEAGDISFAPLAIGPDPAGGRSMIYQINLFVTASKYQVTALEDHIKGRFNDCLWSLTGGRLHPRETYDVVRYVYVDKQHTATELRAPILTHLMAIMRSVKDTPEFKALLFGIPELFFELLTAAVRAHDTLALTMHGGEN